MMTKNNEKVKRRRKIIIYSSKLLTIFVFVVLFLYMFVYCLFFSRTTESDYDEGLAEFPEFSFSSLFSGEYTSGIMKYFSDTIHGRDDFKAFSGKLRYNFGIHGNEQIIGDPSIIIEPPPEFYETEAPEETTTAPPQTKPPEEEGTGSTNPPQSEEPTTEAPVTDPPVTRPPTQTPGVEVEIGDNIVIIGNRAMEIYYGSLKYGTRYAKYVSNFASDLDGVATVYSMVIPKSCAYYTLESENFKKIAEYTPKNLDNITASMSDKVKTVNVYEMFKAHTGEDIMFRTDHHWTALGAYYAAEHFASVAGVDFAPLNTYTKNVRKGFVGTMYKYSNYNPVLKDNPDDFVTYVPSAPYTAQFYNQTFTDPRDHDIFFYVADEKVSSWYLTFIGGDNYVAHIKSGVCNNGRKLMILKDSYGNALAPYFLNSFEEIYIADIREFELNAVNFIKDKGVTDVLFAVSAYSATNRVCENIEVIRTK